MSLNSFETVLSNLTEVDILEVARLLGYTVRAPLYYSPYPRISISRDANVSLRYGQDRWMATVNNHLLKLAKDAYVRDEK